MTRALGREEGDAGRARPVHATSELANMMSAPIVRSSGPLGYLVVTRIQVLQAPAKKDVRVALTFALQL
jgi:hypothetical protein